MSLSFNRHQHRQTMHGHELARRYHVVYLSIVKEEVDHGSDRGLLSCDCRTEQKVFQGSIIGPCSSTCSI